MILSNVELHKALDEKRLVIHPEPLPRFPSVGSPHCPFDTHSVDLRLASEIVVPHKDGQFTYDLTQSGSLARTIQRNSKTFIITEEQPFTLKPNQFVLGRTCERIELPIAQLGPCLAARIEGKSSRARVGLLVYFTAPTVHPGFSGTLTLEMINLGAASLLLYPNMPIAQLIVEEVKGTPTKNQSQFQNQSTATGLNSVD